MGALLSNPNNYDSSSDYSSSTEDEEKLPEKPKLMDKLSQNNEPDNCFDSATDAVGSSTYVSTRPIMVSSEDVFFIEENLDLYEKVSLVYLLYDDPQVALQALIKLLNGGSEKLLKNWADFQTVDCSEKFVEALCIIQNYQVLNSLGYQRKDLHERFLPHHIFTAVNVNKTRKALYLLCEDLTEAETQRILDLVYNDFTEKRLEFKMFQSTYLELFLLYWEAVGYIKQDCLNNLYSVLKQLEYLDMVDKLKQIVPAVNATNNERVERSKPVTSNKTMDANQKKKSPKTFEQILNEGSLLDLSNMGMSLDTMVNVNTGNCYEIDPENPGVCLIINQENFYTEIDPAYKDLLPPAGNKLESRLGTEKDKQDLEATFKMFNFRTELADNLTHTEIIPKIVEVIDSITNESSLFICIMSHGGEGVIYGVNSCKVSVQKIQRLMCFRNRKNLSRKPKVLILQSCQGTECQKIVIDDEPFDDITTDGPSSSDNQEIVPPLADLYTFWATVPGYGAIRNKKTGSWFIQSLCEKMKALGNKEHFGDICVAVTGDVSSKKWIREKEGVAGMVPLQHSTFTKRFYLPPIRKLE